MIFNRVKNIGKELDWYRNNSSVFGIKNDYFLRIGDGWGYKYIDVIFPKNISDSQRERLEIELKNNQNNLNMMNFPLMKGLFQSYSRKHSSLLENQN